MKCTSLICCKRIRRACHNLRMKSKTSWSSRSTPSHKPPVQQCGAQHKKGTDLLVRPRGGHKADQSTWSSSPMETGRESWGSAQNRRHGYERDMRAESDQIMSHRQTTVSSHWQWSQMPLVVKCFKSPRYFHNRTDNHCCSQSTFHF